MANEATTETVEQNVETKQTTETPTTNNAEVEKLKAEMAKLKAANDNLAKEAGDAKKALRAKQSAEEAAAEEAKEQQEAQAKELAELRKKIDIAETSKKVMTFVTDEAIASEIAESLYGAANSEAVIAAIQKAWKARENELKLKYGKIPAPGAGSADGATMTKDQLFKMKGYEVAEFAAKHPDEYNKIMGR